MNESHSATNQGNTSTAVATKYEDLNELAYRTLKHLAKNALDENVRLQAALALLGR